MSKNITIQEGGIAKQLTVDKLKTNLVGGGTQLWVPEDETQLITKSITENGTYTASRDGAYGYSEVVVNVASGSVSGKGADGNTHNYSTDNQGNIVDEVIPDTIVVTTPPANPYGIYNNGQTITTGGMVVNAYNGDGTEYGTVPLNEITISPTTAVYDASTDHGASGSSELLPYSVSLSTVMEGEDRTVTPPFISRESASPGSVLFTIQESDGAKRCVIVKCSEENVFTGGESYTHDGKTVYYYTVVNLSNLYSVYPDPIRASSYDIEIQKAAWTAIYGNISRAGSHQTINVSWPRPGDGLVLETSFEILVAPLYSSGED